MTPKEKALEFKSKFNELAPLVIDEIIKYEERMIEELDIYVHSPGWLNLINWNEVKNELKEPETPHS
jgi:hypothetical protein